MAVNREAWITGIGLASSLGEGLDAHWDALNAGTVSVNNEKYAPCQFHPLAPINFDQQIPKKGDQRQMEPWQRIGTYAAGLALDTAGVKGNTDILSRTDMIVAAGGGERDVAVDCAIMTERAQGQTGPGILNDRLMSGLRPTLFLAQLSNLVAGNISIVHGVTGSSRTFMGEEAAGVDAVRIALAKIAAGQSDIALVGAASNGDRSEVLMLYEFGGHNLRGDFLPVWARGGNGKAGFVIGSGGVFVVIEAREHAEKRGAKPFARLAAVASEQSRRKDDTSISSTLQSLWKKTGADGKADAIITGATGVEPATRQERDFLKAHSDIPVRATGTAFGHLVEAQFPLALAIASLSLSRGKLPAPNDPTGFEKPSDKKPKAIAAIGVGHWRGEGMALLEAVDN